MAKIAGQLAPRAKNAGNPLVDRYRVARREFACAVLASEADQESLAKAEEAGAAETTYLIARQNLMAG